MKKKKRTEVVVRLDSRFRISPRLAFTLVLFFIGCMGMALTYAVITETRHEINMVRAELAKKRDDNTALRANIVEKYTLDEIESIAVGRLGMNKPDSSQIIHIYVPKQNHSELNVSQEPEPESVFQTVVTFFKSLVEF